MRPILMKGCEVSLDWTVETDALIKQNAWNYCIKDNSVSPFQECLAYNVIFLHKVTPFFICYDFHIDMVAEGNIEEGIVYNLYRVAACESSYTHHSDSEMFVVLAQCMVEVKGTVEARLNLQEYYDFWDCVTLHYWYNGHGWDPPSKDASEKAKQDCKASSGISQSAYDSLEETKVYTEEMIPYAKCVLETEGIIQNDCVLIDRSWQRYQDLNGTEVIHALRQCYYGAAGENSLSYVDYLNCVSGRLGRTYF